MSSILDVELLVIPDCPNEQPAAEALRAALNRAGLEHIDFQIVLIATPHQAAQRAFTGSPSFFINGQDLLPEQAPPALACRIYRSPSGESAGIPEVESLRAAIDLRKRHHPIGHQLG